MGGDGSGDEPANEPTSSRPDPAGAPRLRAALSTVRPEGAVASVERIEAGGSRSTVAVRFVEADPMVVRHSDDRQAIETEAALLAAVATETTVPVPVLLGWGPPAGNLEGSNDATDGNDTEASSDGNGGWLATRFVDGDDLHARFVDFDPAARCDLTAAFGRFLGELHAAFRFDGYGPIVADGGELQAVARQSDGNMGRDHATAWRNWLVDRGRESLDRLPGTFDAVADAARERLDVWTVETAPTPRLFPWDFRPGNALVRDEEIAAIADWESPLAAGAALSVAKAEYLAADWYVPDEAEALRRAFRTGYGEVRSVPTVEDVHRIVAVAETAVDSRGRVTNPRYPPVGRDEAVRFHRWHLDDATHGRRG